MFCELWLCTVVCKPLYILCLSFVVFVPFKSLQTKLFVSYNCYLYILFKQLKITHILGVHTYYKKGKHYKMCVETQTILLNFTVQQQILNGEQ